MKTHIALSLCLFFAPCFLYSAAFEKEASRSEAEKQKIDVEFINHFKQCIKSLQNCQQPELRNVEQALKNGANPDRLLPDPVAMPQEGQTPLFWACREREGDVLVKLLLFYGAYPNSTDGYNSPLWWAVQRRNIKKVQLLLDHKADPNEEIIKNQTFNIFIGAEAAEFVPLLRAGLNLPKTHIAGDLVFYHMNKLSEKFTEQYGAKSTWLKLLDTHVPIVQLQQLILQYVRPLTFEEHRKEQADMRKAFREKEFKKRFARFKQKTLADKPS